MKRTWLICLLLLAARLHAETYTVTAYCSCAKCCGRANQPTASGRLPKQGVTVAGPRRLPLGTRVEIQGVGLRIVQDRLAKRFDNRFDVYFTNHAEALRFGKRTLNITIIK